jgi:hypothetical protein
LAQLYVMVPGKDQPQLLEVDEVVKRIKAGELPDSANCARLGETNWSPAKDLPEVKEKLGGGSGAAPLPPTSNSFPSIPGASPSQAGAESPFASQAGAQSPFASQGGAQSPFASQAGGSAAAPPAPGGGKGLPKGAMIGGAVALVAILLGIVGFLFYRNSYTRGLVLEHVPEDCAELYYVDMAGIITSDPVRDHFAKFYKNARDLIEDDLSKKSKKDKERMEKVIELLKNNGVDETSLREIAICIPPRDEDDKNSFGPDRAKMLIVIGGTFRKGNVLKGIKEATETAIKDEDACKLEDDDGLNMLKCSAELKGSKKEPIYATLVESRVLVASLDKKMVKSVRAAKDRTKTYGADKGQHVVFYRAKENPSYDGAYGESKLTIGKTDTVLTVETHYDAVKGKKKLEDFKDGEELVKKKEKFFKDAADKCFEKTPYDMFAESIERTKVEAFDDGVRYEYKVSNKDLAKAFKILADADKEDMAKAGMAYDCVGRTVDPYVSSY